MLLVLFLVLLLLALGQREKVLLDMNLLVCQSAVLHTVSPGDRGRRQHPVNLQVRLTALIQVWVWVCLISRNTGEANFYWLVDFLAISGGPMT